jgi:hypothetical protein
LETALCNSLFGWLLLLFGFSTVDDQLCAIPGAFVSGAHELHFNDAVGYLVVNFRTFGGERFDRAALQGEFVAFKKRKLDTVSGPLAAGQRSGGSGLCGSFRGSGTVSGRSGFGSGRSFRSRGGFRSGSGFRSRGGFGSRISFSFRAILGRSGTVARGRGGAATGHNGDHHEAQQAQKNFAHLFTLSIFC